MAWTILAILGTLLILDVLVHVGSAAIALPVFERKPFFGVKPAAPREDAETLSFPTSDGITLSGSLYLPSDHPPIGVIVFCPELGGNHWSALSYCGGLREAGFAVVAFDFRNQGESRQMPDYDPLHWLTEYEVEDTLSAIRCVRSRDDLAELPLGLVGISRGGGAALAAAARNPEVLAIACEGAFSTNSMFLHYTLRWASLYVPGWILRLVPIWHLRLTLALACRISEYRRGCRYTRLERWLPRLGGRPVWMIAGGRDTYVLAEITKELCRRIGEGCRGVWIVEKAKHNMARQIEPEEYDRRLVAFFCETLAVPKACQPGRSQDPVNQLARAATDLSETDRHAQQPRGTAKDSQ